MLTVSGHVRVNNIRPEHVTDALVTQANSKDWDTAAKVAYDVVRNTCLGRRARTGRYHNMTGAKSFDLRKCDPIVPEHPRLLAEFAEVLGKVVGK